MTTDPQTLERIIAECFADSDISYCPIETKGIITGGLVVIKGESNFRNIQAQIRHSIEVCNAKAK